ncbi:MAG: hypothetical protein KKH83_02305 [Candidatus Margulisbacteria bacterium]|nr:hypothetical protein [Candidatus Margulisiibacteriota bacterium]
MSYIVFFLLLLQPLAMTASHEARTKTLTFSAQPVSTADLGGEWKNYKRMYVFAYAFSYAMKLLRAP